VGVFALLGAQRLQAPHVPRDRRFGVIENPVDRRRPILYRTSEIGRRAAGRIEDLARRRELRPDLITRAEEAIG
jgi:hypothetical protein